MTVSVPNDEPDRCMKCGFCMSTCPVYGVDHIESHVARGRNRLILSADNNEIPLDNSYRECLSYCLLCGRCETVCPAKISSTSITVKARANVVKQKGLTWSQRLVFRGIIKHRPRVAEILRLLALVPGLSEKEGKPLRHLAEMTSILSRGLAIPRLSSPFLSRLIAPRTLPPEGVRTRGEVAIFPGCAFEFFFAGIGKDVVSTLAEAGFEVVYPSGLTCCGLAVQSAGDLDTAGEMARRNMDVLSGFDHIVTGCATCGSALKNYENWFSADHPWRAKARDVSLKVQDFSEFLVGQGFKPQAAATLPTTVTYHDPCHLKWHQGVQKSPRQLLTGMEGVDFIEMEGADSCCGLGGSFGITHREKSLAIQARKIQSITETNAEAVVTSCPGCLIQLMDGIRRHRLPVKAMHISQLICGQTGRNHKSR
jgi:glycolate oxidase iron-sulfur subunit